MNVTFFLSPGYQLLDLAGPACAFELATTMLGTPAYNVKVCSADGGGLTSSLGVELATGKAGTKPVDTAIMIGGDVAPMRDAAQLAAFAKLIRRSRRVASICTGTFMLAELGLLNGKRATTHWRFAGQLQREYPRIVVEPDRIFVRSGDVWTSAGISAGIDLALALIEADYGAQAARQVAHDMVVYHRRSGGQSQFSEMAELGGESDRIQRAMQFARQHIREPLSGERLAGAANLSLRQFQRAFRRETGETPAKAIERMRVEDAKVRIEDTAVPIEDIAQAVGFTDTERMRRAFLRIYGQPPQSIRRISRQSRAQSGRR